jgi:glycerol uptake facilitator-like aquaporin
MHSPVSHTQDTNHVSQCLALHFPSLPPLLLLCCTLCGVAAQIVAFGSISAMFNPAAAMSQVVAGNLSARQFFTVIAGEMAGAILGGLTVYLLYMPQLYKAGAKVRTVCRLGSNHTPCWTWLCCCTHVVL